MACVFLFQEWQQDPSLAKSVERGRSVFGEFCVACHQACGQGIEGVYPPLAGSDCLRQQRVPGIRGVKYGQRVPLVVNGVTYDNAMMPPGLSESEIADVMNFVRNSSGNQAKIPPVTSQEAASIGPH